MRISRVWGRTLRHWRAGTLGRRLAASLRRGRVDDKVRWFGADSENEALKALVARAGRALNAASGSRALVVGRGGDFQERLRARLERAGLACWSVALEEAVRLPDAEAGDIAVILCADFDARSQTEAVRGVAGHPVLARLPFEHVPGLDPSRAWFEHLDEYADTDFISPVLLDEPTPYAIYRESLAHFEQKCGLRDFLDLYQLLKSVVDNDVSGDIAEFGSYRGHSGWLIARSLEGLGSAKRVYLFDTFDSFPEESYGVDHFWSATHPVNFEQVRAKFTGRDNVTLVRGDFTQTLAEAGIASLALAYIDCDSYRATRYLLQTLPDAYLAGGGMLVCEDYGHPALLGNRAAVHEVFDGRAGWFRYFSQFSGLYIAVKVGTL